VITCIILTPPPPHTHNKNEMSYKLLNINGIGFASGQSEDLQQVKIEINDYCTYQFADSATLDGHSSMSDGKILATASAQLKIFECSDHKKIQKFSGHPVSVMQFYILFVSKPFFLFSLCMSEY
jgi:hypothetical protein